MFSELASAAALIRRQSEGDYTLRIEWERIDQEQRNRINSVRVYNRP
jgi:hypothetical protein